MKKTLITLCTFLASGFAIAADCTPTSYSCVIYGGSTGQGSSPSSACSAAIATGNAAQPSNGFSFELGAKRPGYNQFWTIVKQKPGGEIVTEYQVATYNPPDANCIAPPVNVCAADAGKTSLANVTVGYTRSSNENDFSVVGPVTKTPPGTALCKGGCAVTTQDSNSSTPGVAAYRSQVPNEQGLYRMSLDLPVTASGSNCSGISGGASTGLDPTTPDVPCPGFVGEINGKKGCYGTANSPVNVVQSDRPPVGERPGNPAAGPVPSSGEGSGSGAARTPAAGSGGSAGGPASAAAGAPSGSASAPAAGQEQLNCGAPGQPRCKIDESGTGDGRGAFDEAEEKARTSKDAIKNSIDGAANIEAPKWSFSFAFPTGCTPYTTAIRGFVMNPCAYQSTIHDLMSMIWAAVSAFCIIGMVGRTIRES